MTHVRLRMGARGAAPLIALAWCAAVLPAHGAERAAPRLAPAAVPAEAATSARVIVKFKAEGGAAGAQALGARRGAVDVAPRGPQKAAALSARLGLTLRDGQALAERVQLIRADGIASHDLAERLARQPDVEYAVVDGRKRALVAPNDPLYADGQAAATPSVGQWYLRAPDATRVAAINAEAAWTTTIGNPGVVVAVLDTGVRFDHPDFTGKLLPGYDFISDVPTAADGNARDNDPSDPGDFVTQSDVSGPNPVPGCTSADIGNSSWHGTETAGLIGAATNNGIGMASVGRNVTLLPVRVLGKCGGYDSDIQAAMLWAAGLPVAGVPTNLNPAKVVNLSLGSAGVCNRAYQDVVNQLTAAGVIVVAAAGNDGLAVGSPANCVGAIAVAGVRHTGTKVGYSDLGSAVTLSAPAGNCVNLTGDCLYPLITTTNAGATVPIAYGGVGVYSTGGANASLGTSFSAPLVAGTAALMLSANAALTPAQVRSALIGTTAPFPASSADPGVRACTSSPLAQTIECFCTTSTCGAGLLDAGAAVSGVAAIWANIVTSPATPGIGRSVSLTGSVSSASGPVSGVTYAWTITRGAAIAAFTSATNGATAVLVPSAAGSVVVELAATGTGGRHTVTSTTLSVSGPPTASIAAPGGSLATGVAIALDGSGSQASAAGSLEIASYQWTITGGDATAYIQGASNGVSVSILPVSLGTITVTLTVTDSAGQQATASQVLVVSSGGAGGGGGAVGWGGLLAGLVALFALRVRAPRRASP